MGEYRDIRRRLCSGTSANSALGIGHGREKCSSGRNEDDVCRGVVRTHAQLSKLLAGIYPKVVFHAAVEAHATLHKQYIEDRHCSETRSCSEMRSAKSAAIDVDHLVQGANTT